MMPGDPASARPTTTARNGTTSLYAALDLATGQSSADCTPRHRAIEFSSS